MTIFHEDRDYLKFRWMLAGLKQTFGFELYNYCLMPNHFHLLLRGLHVQTRDIMHKLMTWYACWYKAKYDWTGHVFQGRYKSILCEDGHYFDELMRYIPLNPVRAGLVRSPGDWRWSGYNEFIGQQQLLLLDRSIPLADFSPHPDIAVVRYIDFVRAGIPMGRRPDLYPPDARPFLGTPAFVEKMCLFHGIEPPTRSLEMIGS